MSEPEDPIATLEAAEAILRDGAPGTAWARATAHLTRQALEGCLHGLWRDKKHVGLVHAPMRTQLLCLPTFLEPELARRVAWTWQALSQAGHHHGYEMAPSADDLVTWVRTVRELIVAVRR